MRIRGSSFHSPSSSSSSLSSFTSSSPSSLNSSSSIDDDSQCEGLDLLVKAVLLVRQPVIFGIRFTQKKVIRRGKRTLRFKKILTTETEKEEEDNKITETENEVGDDMNSNPRTRKRVMALPSKYKDSVLQPWKRRTRQRR